MLRKILDSKYFQIPYKIIKAIIFIVLLLYVVFTIIQRVSGNQSIFGYRLFAVATGSMVPDYNINDVLAIKEVNHNEIKVGDDITYLGKKQDVSGKIVTHRIIEIEEKNGKKTYLTKGINNDVEDPTYNIGWSFENYKKQEEKMIVYSHNMKNVSSQPLINDSTHQRFEPLMGFIYKSFVDNNKDLIAVEYTSNPFSGNIPKWIEDLRFLCEKTVG